MADAFLTRRAVVLAERAPTDSLRRSDGTRMPAAARERLYSTPELLALEQQIIDYAVDAQSKETADGATVTAAEGAISRRPTLSLEQADMVRRLLLDGDRVAIVVGQAGTGKTYALGAGREAWQETGREVRGVALARRAARELEATAGIPSTSVTALLLELERDAHAALPWRSVLVIDEAALVPTRELARVIAHAQRQQVKVALVGDDRQLRAIGAGGAFRGLRRRLSVIELTENRRQREGWERDALRLVRDGDSHAAVRAYDQAGRISTGEDATELRALLVADWWATRDPAGSVMIAQRRVDVADLNGRAHALMRSSGALGDKELRIGDQRFSVGDHVVLRRNDRALGVVNGDRGIIAGLDVDRRRVVVELAGRTVALGRDYLERPTQHRTPVIAHGYAITGHLAQGVTYRRTFTLATEHMTREAAYVALSRGRESNRIYALATSVPERAEYAPEPQRVADARETLTTALNRSAAQELATDAIDASSLMHERKELQEKRRDLDRRRYDKLAELRTLEDRAPAWYRPRARNEHAQRLAKARTALASFTRACEQLDVRDRELASRVRAALETEAARMPPARSTRHRGRDVDRGRSLGREL